MSLLLVEVRSEIFLQEMLSALTANQAHIVVGGAIYDGIQLISIVPDENEKATNDLSVVRERKREEASLGIGQPKL